jgi:acyl-coenzyme A synthetase/AMP-(fatty) acid ligase
MEINVAGEQLVCTEPIKRFFTRVRGCRLVNHYGQSESAMVTYHVLDRDPTRWPVLAPIGTPLPGCELLVDTGHDNGTDGVGELLVAGLPVALGYLDQAALNAERYVELAATPHGHTRAFRTGDLVQVVGQGVQFVARTDNDVKLRGVRVNLAEVEAQLLTVPEIAAAVAVVTGGEGRPSCLRAAAVARDPNTRLDEEAILDHLRRTQPDVSVPLSVTQLDAAPRTPSGKLDRDRVAELVERALSV